MNTSIQPAGDVEIINHLPLYMVQPDPNQPRKIFDEERLNELATSIKAHGVMQPIIVRIGDDNQVIIKDGERRYLASQLAGKETIPTITAAGDRSPIDILIDQVACNQHEELKPMEMAEFFERLVTTHLVRLKDIPALLEKRGLKLMERSYISNMRRLVALPDWAKDMINVGTLTPSHGKHVLQASGHDNVLAEIRTGIESEIEDFGHPPTVSELAYMVHNVFNLYYRDITKEFGEDAPEFDIATCEGCKTCKEFKTDWGSAHTYCFDETCYDKKQVDARAPFIIKLEKQTKTADSNDEPDDDRANESKSPQSAALKEGRIERTQLYLDQWLRTQVAEHLANDEATLYAILLWVSAGAPGNNYDTDIRLQHPGFDYETEKHGINITLQHKLYQRELFLSIVDKAIFSMNRKNLRYLAHHCGIVLDGVYIVDQPYLGIKTKQELIETTPEAVRDAFDDWTRETKKPAGELVAGIVNRDIHYGIPADLAEYYEASKPEAT